MHVNVVRKAMSHIILSDRGGIVGPMNEVVWPVASVTNLDRGWFDQLGKEMNAEIAYRSNRQNETAGGEHLVLA